MKYTALFLATALFIGCNTDKSKQSFVEEKPDRLWIRIVHPDTSFLASHPRIITKTVWGRKEYFYSPPNDSLIQTVDTVYVSMYTKRFDTSELISRTPRRAPISRMYHEFTGVVEYDIPDEDEQ